jgi:hypothetical protein
MGLRACSLDPLLARPEAASSPRPSPPQSADLKSGEAYFHRVCGPVSAVEAECAKTQGCVAFTYEVGARAPAAWRLPPGRPARRSRSPALSRGLASCSKTPPPPPARAPPLPGLPAPRRQPPVRLPQGRRQGRQGAQGLGRVLRRARRRRRRRRRRRQVCPSEEHRHQGGPAGWGWGLFGEGWGWSRGAPDTAAPAAGSSTSSSLLCLLLPPACAQGADLKSGEAYFHRVCGPVSAVEAECAKTQGCVAFTYEVGARAGAWQGPVCAKPSPAHWATTLGPNTSFTSAPSRPHSNSRRQASPRPDGNPQCGYLKGDVKAIGERKGWDLYVRQ